MLTQGEETAAVTKSVVPGVRSPSTVLGFDLRAPSLNCVTVSRGYCHHVPKYESLRDAGGGYVQSIDSYVLQLGTYIFTHT